MKEYFCIEHCSRKPKCSTGDITKFRCPKGDKPKWYRPNIEIKTLGLAEVPYDTGLD